MKLPILIGVFLASISVQGTESVQVMGLTESGPELRLVLLHNGKGLVGVRVDIFRSDRLGQEEKRVSTLVSEDGGWLKPPALAPGYYHLKAVLDDKTRAPGDEMRADLCLYVSSHSRHTPTLFPMELADPVAERASFIVKAEQKPVARIVKEFRGTVYDPSGATILRADVRVVRKGTEGKEIVALLKSDEKGEFQTSLPDGQYVAEISSPGFETRVFLFEVRSDGIQKLIVTLNVAAVSEEVSVSQAGLPRTK